MALDDTLFCVACGRAHRRPPRGVAVVYLCPCGQAIRVNGAGQITQPRTSGRLVPRRVDRRSGFGRRVGDVRLAKVRLRRTADSQAELAADVEG